jgi:YHS domain-containing protein
MNAMQKLEQRIKDKIAEHQGEIDNYKNHIGQQMTQVDHRYEQYALLADRLTKDVIRPRLEQLASFFDNAEMIQDPEQVGRHQAVCVFKHTNRFPASARLELGLSPDRQAENLALCYCLQILPIFFDFAKQDQKLIALESVNEEMVAEWFEEKIVAFLDAYLRLETHHQYQSDNIVTDPVCGMPVNRLHAAAQIDHGGMTYFFCVEDCRKKFAEDPDHYMTGKKAFK